MNDEFIPYEEALAMKELGFDGPVLMYWFPNPNWLVGEKFDLVSGKDFIGRNVTSLEHNVKNGYYINTIPAPLWQQDFRWFRDKYDMDCEVQARRYTSRKHYVYYIFDGINAGYASCIHLAHDEAQLECLQKLIKIVKERQ